MPQLIRTLPDAELAVMQAVWACEVPVLSRLAEKGFLKIEKTGRSAEYWPLITKEDYLARQGQKFYDQLCGKSIPAFAAALCASGLSAEELAELRELLKEGSL